MLASKVDGDVLIPDHVLDLDPAEKDGNDDEVEDEQWSIDFKIEALEECAKESCECCLCEHLPELHFQNFALKWLVLLLLTFIIFFHVIRVDLIVKTVAVGLL